MNKKEFMNYIKAEFPEVINTHWNWCLLENI